MVKLKIGVNDLGTIFPKLAEEWHPIKNGDLTPLHVTFGTPQKAWWKCSVCGREWEASIARRSQGSGCQSCSARIIRSRKEHAEI